MLDYSKYHAAMIAVTNGDYAFVYWCDRMLRAHEPYNYGRGKQHWIEYLGRKTKAECRTLYPHTPILDSEDPRINVFLKGKMTELEILVSETS